MNVVVYYSIHDQLMQSWSLSKRRLMSGQRVNRSSGPGMNTAGKVAKFSRMPPARALRALTFS